MLMPRHVRQETRLDTGLRFLVSRQDLQRTRVTPDPDAPMARPLAEGELRLAVDQFAFTANNITYAAFGESMKYWQFFSGDDGAWGCIPVWGFATVCESRVAGVDIGRRVYGYLPMGSFHVAQAVRVDDRGFIDALPHRVNLPAAYNHYQFCNADPGYRSDREGQQALLRPLFTTSFLLDDFLREQQWFGATQVLLSSASSKTAYGLAFCLRRDPAQAPRVVGLSSPNNLPFAERLATYDTLRAYDGLESLDPAQPTVYVDFAGDSALRRRIHQHFGSQLAYSCAVGGTHWQGLAGSQDLPGPRPTLFFAPAQLKKRLQPAPEGWGRDGFQQRLADAWSAFMVPVCDSAAPWLVVQHRQGLEAVEQVYREQLDGRADAKFGTMLKL